MSESSEKQAEGMTTRYKEAYEYAEKQFAQSFRHMKAAEHDRFGAACSRFAGFVIGYDRAMRMVEQKWNLTPPYDTDPDPLSALWSDFQELMA